MKVILIVANGLNCHWLGSYGNEWVTTPTLDRLASEAVVFDIEADAFLPQMVRRLTGALVRVGRGSLQEEDFVRLLEQAEQGTLGPTAPAHGLCLLRVRYDEGYTP